MYRHKTTPFGHQAEEFDTHFSDGPRALFWEMGTGKSKVIIDTAARLYEAGEIDAVIVVAPPSVHFNWKTDEFPAHLPDHVMERTAFHVWQTIKSNTLWHKRAFEEVLADKGLPVLCISYSGFMTKKGKAAVAHMLNQKRCLYVLDESTNIKNPGAKRTKSITASGRYAHYKRILTGTPVANSPFDVYSQIKFLDENYWKRKAIRNAAVFREMFGIFHEMEVNGVKTGEKFCVGYDNLEVLQGWVADISSRVLKEDVLDLPPKLYSKVYFDLTSEQRRAYDDLKSDFETELADGQLATAPLVIQRLTRFRQITGGYLPTDEGDVHRFANNPRLGIAEEWRDACAHPGIVWCNYDHEVDDILSVLGDRAVRHDGKTSELDRERAKLAFKNGDAQFFVAKPSVGGTGLTMVNAKHVLYYSNSFNLMERQQSEDRAHRIGQEDSVDYTDVIANDTIDEHIIKNLMKKFDIGAQVTGDQAREWL